MSISQEGLDAKVKTQIISVKVSKKDLYVRMANAIDWIQLAAVCLPDLENTKKGFYWLGRKIFLRIHLSVMILQSLLKASDRGIEETINNCPRFQAFCGRGIVENWKCPDHTKIEDFRNRLSPETHKKISDSILQIIQKLGYTNPTWMDVDSTVQEANMTYPSDAKLMRKLAQKGKQILSFLQKKLKKYLPKNISIDMPAINKKAKGYFFLAKNLAKEKRRRIFAEYHNLVEMELKDFISFAKKMTPRQIQNLPWNIKRSLEQIRKNATRYLSDVGHYVKTNTLKKGKILSWHLKEVVCIIKNKAGKDKEFGRQVQLGRVDGNFMVAFSNPEVKMEDKSSVDMAIQEHAEIFGPGILKEIGTDKGYYSGKNISTTEKMAINADGIQRPCNVKNGVPEEVVRTLRDRRAGIEPLIGHVKLFGLAKSKMKSDRGTLASVYRSVSGFNLHQLKRKMNAKEIKLAS